MNLKLSNPFKDQILMITQTTHNDKGGTTDFSMVNAIDCNAKNYSRDVFMEGDGEIVKAVNHENPNSFIHVHYDGMPESEYREFVHCRPQPSLEPGRRLNGGVRVGQLEPTVRNWYGNGKDFLMHLHLSFYDSEKRWPPSPFDYMDRGVEVGTNYSVIRNDRKWFKADGSFNWDSFRDLKLKLEAPTPPPVEPPSNPCSECEEKLLELSKRVDSAEDSIRQLQKQVELLAGVQAEMGAALGVISDTLKKYSD